MDDLDITDVKQLQKALVDLMDGKYNEGDNDFGIPDERFMELVEMKDRIIAIS